MAGRKRSAAKIEESDSDVAAAPVTKKTKSTSSVPAKDSDGNVFWELGKNRRVTISEFRKAKFVSIREYYEKDGKTLPGKKGISLSLEQYQDVLKLIPAINAELEEQTGQNFDEPDGAGAAAEAKIKTKKKVKEAKANIDATSDEDED